MQINFSEYTHQKETELPQLFNDFLRSQSAVILTKGAYTVRNVFSSLTITLSHWLIKINSHEWHVMEGYIGQGTYGKVYSSKMKIILKENKARIVLVDVVLKEISLKDCNKDERAEKLKSINEEAQHQQKNRIQVFGIAEHKDNAYLITEYCGMSLDKFLDTHNIDFDFMLAISLGVSKEFLSLERLETVHRDLKPSNICIKITGTRTFRIKFIDYGMAKLVSFLKEHSVATPGTYLYLAPEAFSSRITCALDRWTIGPIFGEIFKCEDIFKYKQPILDKIKVAEKKDLDSLWKKFFDASYCYDKLFANIKIPLNVDKTLLQDFKELLKKHEERDPKDRPSIALTSKFLNLIATRREAYHDYCLQWSSLQKVLNRLQQCCRALSLTNASFQLKEILNKNYQASRSLNSIIDGILKGINTIIMAIKSLPRTKSHLIQVEEMLKSKLRAQEYVSPFPNLSKIIEAAEAWVLFLEAFQKHFVNFEENLRGEKFRATNSSGMERLQLILAQQNTPFEKIVLMNTVGSSKLEPSVCNWYSQSSLFGKGRHRNIQSLYIRLSGLGQSPLNVVENLNEINNFINKNTFR